MTQWNYISQDASPLLTSVGRIKILASHSTLATKGNGLFEHHVSQPCSKLARPARHEMIQVNRDCRDTAAVHVSQWLKQCSCFLLRSVIQNRMSSIVSSSRNVVLMKPEKLCYLGVHKTTKHLSVCPVKCHGWLPNSYKSLLLPQLLPPKLVITSTRIAAHTRREFSQQLKSSS